MSLVSAATTVLAGLVVGMTVVALLLRLAHHAVALHRLVG